MHYFLIKGGQDGKQLYFIENLAERFDRSKGGERPSNDEYILSRINLERLVDETDTTDLKILRKGVFKLPTHADKTSKFQPKHNDVLKMINLDEKHKILTAYPIVASKEDQDYLVLVGNYAWTSGPRGDHQQRVETVHY